MGKQLELWRLHCCKNEEVPVLKKNNFLDPDVTNGLYIKLSSKSLRNTQHRCMKTWIIAKLKKCSCRFMQTWKLLTRNWRRIDDNNFYWRTYRYGTGNKLLVSCRYKQVAQLQSGHFSIGVRTNHSIQFTKPRWESALLEDTYREQTKNKFK